MSFLTYSLQIPASRQCPLRVRTHRARKSYTPFSARPRRRRRWRCSRWAAYVGPLWRLPGSRAPSRVVARLLEFAREVVPTAYARVATSPPAALLVGSDSSPGDIIASCGDARYRGGGRPVRYTCGHATCVSGGDDASQVRVRPVFAHHRWRWQPRPNTARLMRAVRPLSARD